MEDMYVDIFNHQPDLEDLLQFILDSSALLGGEEAIQSQLRADIEKASRCLCHRLHIERYKRLSHIPNKKMRATKVRGSGRSTNL